MAAEPMPGRPPTIRTVAARAGVSKSLVSLVLQNSPRVSELKRQAVLKAVAELGYRPDPVARSLAERRTRTVGVVIDDLSNPWYVELLDGLRPVLHEHGLRPLLADGRNEPDAVQALSDLRVDGLVLVGTPDGSRRSSRPTPWVARSRPSSRGPGSPAVHGRRGGQRRLPRRRASPRPTCWSWGTAASRTSSARARWVGCAGRATRR